MLYREVSERLAMYRRDIAALRENMRALQNEAEPQEVENYRFATADGPVRLSDLFGGTRSEPSNVYRLVIRRAAPDFARAACHGQDKTRPPHQ